MGIVVQGIELAAQASEVKLPADAVLIETPGLPEVDKRGARFLISTSGDLYRRVVNKPGHAAIDLSSAVIASLTSSPVARSVKKPRR